MFLNLFLIQKEAGGEGWGGGGQFFLEGFFQPWESSSRSLGAREYSRLCAALVCM